MKNQFFKSTLFSILGLFFAMQIGCSNSSGNKNAVTPINNTCVNGICDNSYYNNFYQNGFLGYGYGNNYWGGYRGSCSCPAGYRPVYSGVIGMGCVQVNYFAPYASSAIFWGNIGGTYTGYVNIPQISNMDTSAYQGDSCYNTVAQSCYLNQANSCSVGYCRAIGNGQTLGICTR